MRTRSGRLLIVMLAVASIAAGPVAAQLLQRHEVPKDLRQALAEKAFALCAARGFDVGVAVADSAGTVRTLVAGDKVSAISIETASRKARSAAFVGFPTSILKKADSEAPAYTALLRQQRPDMLMLAGAVPIKLGDELLGALGVSGASDGEADEACASDAVTALTSRLR